MSKLDGQEHFTFKNIDTDISVNDFWSWAYSDLLNNTYRGVLAEFLVCSALDLTDGIRRDWMPYDILSPAGLRIEVKSAAYLQSWDEEYHEHILFDIAPKLSWTPESSYGPERKRNSDIYVFCLYTALTKDGPILDLNLWEFYVLPTTVLNDKVPEQKSIGLSSLSKLNPVRCDYSALREAIEGANL